MKFYDLSTVFTFGKYQGKIVKQILDIQPTYIEWCATTLDHFCISDRVIEEIKAIKPDFTLSDEAIKKMVEKHSSWENEQETFEDYDEDYDDRNADYNQTDWSNYDDGLDMDQQSIEFWNQF